MEKIVVGIDGIDGIDGSRTAQQARLRGAGLVVIHTWQQPTAALMSSYAPQLADPATLEETARRTLAMAWRG